MTVSYMIISILMILLFGGIIMAVINAIHKRKAKISRGPVVSVRAESQNRPRRMPYRVSPQLSLPASSTVQSITQRRSPHAVQNNESLKYRKCPRCHSENTLARQYVFKTGEHSYYCIRCDHRFNF